MTNNISKSSSLTSRSLQRRGLLVLCLGGLLSGCKTLSGMVRLGPKPVTPEWKSLALRADDDANANSAVALDIVFVRDTAVLNALTKMPAVKWFAERTDMQRSFPEALTVLSFELVPGQIIRVPDKLWRDAASWGVLAFAAYASSGEHRIRLTLDTPGYLIQLGAEDFNAIDLTPGAAK